MTRCLLVPLALAGIAATAACTDPVPVDAPAGLSLGGPTGAIAIDHVAVDAAGATIIGGRFSGTVAVGPGAPLAALAQDDGFVARVDAAGAVAWARGFGGQPAAFNRDDRVTGVATMADGSVVVTGYVEGMVDLGGGPLPATGAPGALFVARYAADGRHLWSQRWPSAADASEATAPTVGADGAIYLAAHFTGGATIGAQHLTFASTEAVAVKLTADGALVWARPLRTGPVGPFAGAYGASAPVVIGDAVYLSGGISGPVDLGTGPLAESEAYATYVVELAAATGATRRVRGYPEAATPYGGRHLLRTPDGGLALDGPHVTYLNADLSIARAIDLAALTNFDAFAGRAVIRADGEVVWIAGGSWVRLGGDGAELERATFPADAVGFAGLALGPDGQVTIVGGYRAPFALGDATFASPDGARTRGFMVIVP